MKRTTNPSPWKRSTRANPIRTQTTTAALWLALSLPSIALPQTEHGTLSRFDSDAGWVTLFDGHSTTGWRGIGKEAFPDKGWDIVDGCLHHAKGGGGGDLITDRLFGDFELEFEWRVAPGANSGIKYLVRDKPGDGSAFGPEYQVLDDTQHENGSSPKTSAGALYAVVAVEKAQPPHVGGFNNGRIVSRGDYIEHWLNGQRLFALDREDDLWKAGVADSKFKESADFATPGPGAIALQDHGDEVWYRNLRLRELPAPAEFEVELYDGKSLEHWYEYGDAEYSAEGDSILGKVGGGGQSFLISKRNFGDFIFECDVKTEEPGNSGIQIRTHQKDKGRPFGYQIEIDPSERSWSGGLYDEARRGWLQNLENNPAGREAFVYQEWNHFRIEAIGPWFQVRVNGIPTTDYFDTMDLEGFIGLQVHSGNNTKVRWRNPRVWDLGQREWELVTVSTKIEAKPWTWGGGPGAVLQLPQRGTDAAQRSPVLKFGLLAPAGELHVLLSDTAPASGEAHDCGSETDDAIASGLPGGWCVRVQASKTYKPEPWNEVSIGFEGDRCALSVNGRTEEVVRKMPGRNGAKLFLISIGADAQVQVRDPMLLGEARR